MWSNIRLSHIPFSEPSVESLLLTVGLLAAGFLLSLVGLNLYDDRQRLGAALIGSGCLCAVGGLGYFGFLGFAL